MPPLKEYDVVKVVRLATEGRHYTGTESVRRPPCVGDIATICHELDPANPEGSVIVEMVDSDGMTVWLADFSKDELELVTPQSP